MEKTDIMRNALLSTIGIIGNELIFNILLTKKTMKKLLIFMFAFETLLLSCEKNNNDGFSNVEEGVETYATFIFESNVVGTKALPNDQDETEKILDGYIFIFNEDGNQELQTVANIDLTSNATTLSTTSGRKRVFVLTNVPTNITSQLFTETSPMPIIKPEAATLAGFYAVMTNDIDVVPGAVTSTNFEAGFNGLVKSTGEVFMSNGASSSSLFTLEPRVTESESKENLNNNNIKITLKRGVAKTVMAVTAPDLSGDGKFTFTGTYLYAPRNLNRSAYAVQHFQTDDDIDSDNSPSSNPVYGGTRPQAPYYYAFTADLENAAFTDADLTVRFRNYYYDYDLTTTATDLTADAFYIPENSNNNQVVGNTTYLGFEAQVSHIPAAAIATNVIVSAGGEANGIVTAMESVNDGTSVDYTPASGHIYVMRQNISLGLVFDPHETYAMKSGAVVFQVVYNVLEQAGVIGTDDNVKLAPYWALWGVTSEAEVPAMYKTGGELYFENSTKLMEKFFSAYAAHGPYPAYAGETDMENPKSNAGYFNPTFIYISDILEAAGAGRIEDILGLYIDGKTYYKVYLYENPSATSTMKNHLVRRNHSYNVNVTNIQTIGVPNIDMLEKDPQEPLDNVTTNITAVITVQPWGEVNIEEEV